jgi:hypothetical protein
MATPTTQWTGTGEIAMQEEKSKTASVPAPQLRTSEEKTWKYLLN